MMFLGNTNLNTVVPIAFVQRQVFYHQHAGGMYGAAPYVLSQVRGTMYCVFSHTLHTHTTTTSLSPPRVVTMCAFISGKLAPAPCVVPLQCPAAVVPVCPVCQPVAACCARQHQFPPIPAGAGGISLPGGAGGALHKHRVLDAGLRRHCRYDLPLPFAIAICRCSHMYGSDINMYMVLWSSLHWQVHFDQWHWLHVQWPTAVGLHCFFRLTKTQNLPHSSHSTLLLVSVWHDGGADWLDVFRTGLRRHAALPAAGAGHCERNGGPPVESFLRYEHWSCARTAVVMRVLCSHMYI